MEAPGIYWRQEEGHPNRYCTSTNETTVDHHHFGLDERGGREGLDSAAETVLTIYGLGGEGLRNCSP